VDELNVLEQGDLPGLAVVPELHFFSSASAFGLSAPSVGSGQVGSPPPGGSPGLSFRLGRSFGLRLSPGTGEQGLRRRPASPPGAVACPRGPRPRLPKCATGARG
jgi:hypothetical protein